MARQPTLAEILADDTGRIRPEVADLLMEPPPPRLRPQPRPRPPRQPGLQPGYVPPPHPRHYGTGWAVFSLIIFIAILALIIPKDRKPDDKTSGVSKGRSSKGGSVFAKSQEELPGPPMVEEKIELERPNAESSRTRQGGNIPYAGADPLVSRAETFNRRPQIEEQIAKRSQAQRWYTCPPRPSLESRRESIRIYIAQPVPNRIQRCQPPIYPAFRQPYYGNRPRITSYQNVGTAIVERRKIAYVRERIRRPAFNYPYYNHPPPPMIYHDPYFAFGNRRVVSPYRHW